MFDRLLDRFATIDADPTPKWRPSLTLRGLEPRTETRGIRGYKQKLAAIAERVPGAHIKVLCAKGERLSDHDQDVGSYRYCITNLAAPSREELHARYAVVEQLLPFRFAEPDGR